MLAGSLDLEEPWYITGAEFNPVKNVIDVYVGIREDAVIACPHCGGSTKRYGYEPTERSWRHADCLFYPCYVHCKRPRVKCDNCGIQQVTAPFERQNSPPAIRRICHDDHGGCSAQEIWRRPSRLSMSCMSILEETIMNVRT